MAANVRVRRPATPPPGLPHVAPSSHKYPPIRQDHLSADERREAASKGYGPGRRSHSPGGLNITSGEWKLLAVVLLIAIGVRMFRISKPDSVVFDEVHFGKFAARYIKTRYFVDVHPPLAKLLITAAAFVSGFNGEFDFKEIGKVFENAPYVAMRMVPATFGVATVPTAYLTLRALDCRATTALLASVFLTFENGLITQSRHILLDSPLVFFTALTVFFFVGFSNEDKKEPFTEQWWTWLILTGLSLGAVVSCKWVGLFTIATVGVCTILQLWLLLGDLRVSPRMWARHFFARAVCLILIPILFYMTMFQLHFLILGSSGEGDAFMSSEFRQTLGHGMEDTYADVAIGSDITIRHLNTQGGYLHSHAHNYPGGSAQQQITLYPHRDENNLWRVFNATVDGYEQYDYEHKPIVYIDHGSHIKLRHVVTDKALHSHEVRPPVSDVDFQNEVSGYGMAGFIGDINDDWVVEIEKGDRNDKESSKRLRTLRTHFKLRHLNTGCYLFSHKVKLPEWGFDQQEVTCNKNAVKANSLWYVETVAKHPQLPADAQKVNYKIPGFLSKFWELQQVMWTTNAGLTDRHMYDSRPLTWPRLRRGINFWVKDHRQIYLIGNPFVWWSSTASVIAYMIVRGFLVLRAKRGYRDFDNTKVAKYDSLCSFLFIGYCMHYFPFFLMGRQLFLHHYFPALYFAILLNCAVFDLATSTLRPKIRLQIAAVLMIMVIITYSKFSSLTYGDPWTKKKCTNAQWVKTWDFACNEFLDEYSQYSGVTVPTLNRTIPMATIGGEPGGRAAIVVEDKLGQDGVAPPQDEQSTAVLNGAPEPGRDIFAKDKQKEIKSQMIALQDVPVIVDEKDISVVTFEPTTAAAPEIAAGGKEEVKVQEGNVGTGEPEDQAHPEVIGILEEEIEAIVGEDDDDYRKPHGPLDHEEAIADQVAHELYPEARDAE
ncbi:glycosyltransferase family 39 protein [Suillus clintonianus]|uniref:glycosyltransferase family 39 protein n=1 Tax=Suillus clintonianus TaxID=1904413 RepID=UPI001B8651B1|nr:glycosyltransferase family 39 protein [Suillus clintonianus]KAG2124692.1 glycosyltransferase family 39 protein [Suillus clintonianus]